jgi:hypothetical protein
VQDEDQDEESLATTLMAMDDETLYAFGDWLVMVAIMYDREMEARRQNGH